MTEQDHISRVWDVIEKARVGMLTTRLVVEGIFLVIVMDAAFSVMFSVLGI